MGFTVKRKGQFIVVPESVVIVTPLDNIVEIESHRIRLGLKKKQLCEAAEIKPEMYSYMLRRGNEGHDLPIDCLNSVRDALVKMEKALQPERRSQPAKKRR